MQGTLTRKWLGTRRVSENPFALSNAKGLIAACGFQTLRVAQGERNPIGVSLNVINGCH